MKQFTQVNKSSVMVTKWSRNGREMVSIKPLLALGLMLTLGTVSAWGQSYHGTTWYSLYETTPYDGEVKTLSVSTIHSYSNLFVPNSGTVYFDAYMNGNDNSKYYDWGWQGRSTDKNYADPQHYGVSYPINITVGNTSADVYATITASQTSETEGISIWKTTYYYYNYSYTYASSSATGFTTTNTSFDVKIPKNSTNDGKHVYIQNMKVPVGRHILLSDGSANGTTSVSKSFSDTKVEATSSAQTVSFRSFLTSGNITISLTSGDAEVFRLGSTSNTTGSISKSKDNKSYEVGNNACASANGTSNATAGGSTLGDISKYGFNVYFYPKAAATYNGTITITDGTSTATVTLSGKGVLNDNAITWNVNTTDKKNWGSQVDANATATNTNYSGNTNSRAITYTVENGKSSYVTIANGKITFNKAGAGQTVKITAAQAANYKYKAASLEKTFTIKSTQSLAYRDTTIDVSTSASDKVSANLSTLMSSHTGDGNLSYEIISGENGNLDGSTFYATKANDVKVKVSAASTNDYDTCSTVLTVHVVKRTPTFVWDTFDHIYAGNVLEDVAQAKYGEANVDGLTYTYTSANTDVVVVDGTKLRVQSTGFTTTQNVQIKVETAETDYYKAAKDSNVYSFEPKKTPEFYMSGKAIPAENAKCSLMIGDTVHFLFDKVDESKFSTPQNPQYVSYEHNSTNHTGVLTGVAAGDETILFSQTGTDLINAGSRSVHVYVSRHPVNLATTLDGGTWKVDSVYTGDVYSITEGDGVHALNTVSVTSSDESVLKKVDGNWKAVGAGTATLTITHANTDYWAAETVYAHITVEKYTPVITWNINASYQWGENIDSPVSSSNEELPFKVHSSDSTKAVYLDGDIKVYNKGNNVQVTFTVEQAGNYKWNAASSNLSRTITIIQPNNHVTYNVGDVTLKKDKDRIIAFTGIAKTVKFTPSSGALADRHYKLHWCATENGNYTHFKTFDRDDEGTEQEVTIDPRAKYLKVEFAGASLMNKNTTGTFGGLTITERTEIKPVSNKVTFTTNNVDATAETKELDVWWYNVRPCTVEITGTNADFFQLSANEDTISSSIDKFGKKTLHITYSYPEGGTHTATLHIESEDGYSANVELKATSNKITPAITWKENLTPMQRGVNESNPATSPVSLVYESTDSTVVDIDGSTLKPLKKGNATITASFDGSENKKYNSTSSTIDVEVTDVKVQHINWTQNFKRLKWTDDEVLSAKNTPDFVLVATVSYYDADKEEEITINRPITFTSQNTSVVQVLNGTTLHVVGTGTTTLTAHVDGITDSLYEATTIRDVIVREPSLDCEAWVLNDTSGSIRTINSVEFALNGEADTIYFDAWREPITVVIEYTDGDLYLEEEYANGTKKQLWNAKTEKNTHTSYKAALSRNAKKVRFYTQFGAQGYHNFDGVYARLARYVEFPDGSATKSISFTKEDAKPGIPKTKKFKVKYSNITDQLEFEFKGGVNSKFSVVSPAAIGTECGDKGEAEVTIQFLSNDVDTYKDTLLIHNLNQTLTVYLEAEVDKHHQQITWEPETTLKTTDNVTFNATTTGSAAGLSVTYHVTAGDAATVNETTGALTISKDGEVTIEARAAGNDTYYDAEPVSKTFTISKVKPTITAPTAETMTLPNTSLEECDLTGGAADVDGSFDWDDKTIDATFNNSGYKVVFTPENTDWYDTASCVVVVPVNKIAQTITWNFNVPEMFCNATYAFTGENAATVNNNDMTVVYETTDETVAYVDEAKNLKIVKGGDVTITARCVGNDLYADATPVAKTFTIHRMAPTIVTMPTAATMKIGRLLSDASLTGGRAELNGAQVEGAFVWVDGNTTEMNVAGTFTKQVIFDPANKNYYEPVDSIMDVKVEKYAPMITANTLSGSAINYGQTLANSELSGSLTATDTVKLPNVPVAGTWAWTDTEKVVEAGNPSHAFVTFLPENTDWYTEVEIKNVPLVVNSVQADSYTATAMIVYGERLSEASGRFTNTTTGLFGEHVSGTITWAESVDQTQVLTAGDYQIAIRFHSNNINYVDGDGICTLTVTPGKVFNGGTNGNDNTWGESENWLGGNEPGANDRVTVDANVEITGDVTIGGLTINEGYTVTVTEGSTLTVGDDDSFLRDGYGNLYVENGGKVILNDGELKVNNFVLEASIGDMNRSASSGQVNGEEQLKVEGDAYFQICFDPVAISYGWYDFVLPFDVDVIGGIYLASDTTTPLVNNVDFAIMAFSEARRAQNTKPWTWFSGTLKAGQLYTITLDETKPARTTYIFKKKAGAELGATDTYNAECTGSDANSGWNGIGNGTLRYCQLNSLPAEAKMQVYDHTDDRYIACEAAEYTYAVGTAFFIQATENQEITLDSVRDVRDFRAPSRASRTVSEFRLGLKPENAERAVDHLWVSASEDATGEYTIGHDLIKMGTPTSAKVAQMWSERNGMKLCDIEMPLVNDKASCGVNIYAPKAGTYTLDIERAPEDATLYLTYNGYLIWNLTASPYELELEKGTTSSYGLRIVNAPLVTTDVENGESLNGENGVRKVLIDNVIYLITPEGKMYDIVGKGVKF